MLLPIEKLVGIIAENTILATENKLRILSATLTQPLVENEITKLQERRKLYYYARSFLLAYSPLPGTWANSPACFSQLATWFRAQTAIADHEKWAMHAWYFRLHRSLVNPIASSLVPLGEAFLEAPDQFAAFLWWLLEHNVAFDVIHHSQILHRFFAYYAALEIETVQKTYALLEGTSCHVAPFLQALETAPGVSGFGLYNLRGVAPSSQITLLPLRSENHFSSEIQFTQPEVGVELFELFQWKFITQLNFLDSTHCTVIDNILASDALRAPFIAELSAAILTEAVSAANADNLLAITIRNLPEEEWDVWIQREPFLIHGMRYCSISENILMPAITKLCTQEKYKQLSHIRWLVGLSNNIGHFSCVAHIESASESDQIYNQLTSSALDLALPFGTTLSDQIIEELRLLENTALHRCCEERVQKYSDALSCSITDFLMKRTDYDAVERVWGSTLSQINLFQLLHSAILDQIAYPKDTYALRGMVLHRHYNIQNHAFSVTKLIDLMCDTFSAKKRTLQEIFTLCENLDVQKSIVEWVMTYDKPLAFFYEPFGNDTTVIGRLYFKNDVAALLLVLEKIPSVLEDILKLAIDQRRNDLFCGLLKLNVRDIKSFLSPLVRYAAMGDNWEAVSLLCGLSKDFEYHQSALRKNNIHLYINMLSSEKERRGAPFLKQLRNLMRQTNSVGDTLLHLAARHSNYKTVHTCLTLFKSVFIRNEFIEFLHYKNNAGKMAYCIGDTPNTRQINCFLQRERAQLQRTLSSSASSSASYVSSIAFFAECLPRARQQVEETDNIPERFYSAYGNY